MEEALLWSREGRKIRCFLCAYNCLIPEGESGVCKVRINEKGTLKSKSYGKIIGTKINNIEKMPLYHFFPGAQALFIKSNGNNFDWDEGRTDKIKGDPATPEDVVKMVNKKKIRIIALSGNEPTMFFEFAYKLARVAKRYNIKTVLSTNGYITSEGIKKIGKYLDAVNVRFVGSGDNELYKKYLDVPDSSPIFGALKNFKKHRVFIEVTNTIIPHYGDNEDAYRRLTDWIVNNLDSSVPFHLMDFKPNDKLKSVPVPAKTLEHFANEAQRVGLRFPYIHGEVEPEYETTFCYNCMQPMIVRDHGLVSKISLEKDRCPGCGFKLNLVLE